MDKVSPEQRSRTMARVRGKNTRPEVFLRSLLHKRGFRYRLHVASLPGVPDIVLPKYRTVVFVNGCFWHRHPGCKRASTPTTNVEYWTKKFVNNIARDTKNKLLLEKMGWKVLTVWECELKFPMQLANDLASMIRG
ncbi:very short patch repair endonuclease [Solidesulfovibrio sp. C21]|uniref:very short patch repair endonuclease n=1 Tax=Solidesulfovibrio sp. C21 TaxID=3398613 RepID=UPI0039FCC96A